MSNNIQVNNDEIEALYFVQDHEEMAMTESIAFPEPVQTLQDSSMMKELKEKELRPNGGNNVSPTTTGTTTMTKKAPPPMKSFPTKSAPVKSAPMKSFPTKSAPMKSAPMMMSKKQVPFSTVNSEEDPVARAMDFAERPRDHQLQSVAFSKTRFAKAFEDWANIVAEELKDSALKVAQDARNGYAWSLFANVRKWNESMNIPFDGENVTIIQDVSATPITIPSIPPVENSEIQIEHDPRVVQKFKFRLHPSFVPSVVEQSIPKVSRVGWGSFMCGIEVQLDMQDSLPATLVFEHYLMLKEGEVGVSESTYPVEVKGEKFIIQVGNTFGMIDEGNHEDGALAGIAKNRANRKVHLERTQRRLEEVRKSEMIIDEFISSCEHKQMGLGAVIAAILNGKEMTKDSFAALYMHGRKTIRCVVLDDANSQRFEKFMLGGTALGGDLDAYDVSTGASDIVIDRFISHSWFDNAKTKCATILEWARDFQNKNKRPARIWCDKFCLKQTPEDLKMSVPCLPIYLLACERVLLLNSKTFVSRLWCLTEVYTNYIMRSAEVQDKGFDIIQVDPGSDQTPISVGAARCSFLEDEEALRRNFDRAPGGLSEVEQALRLALE